LYLQPSEQTAIYLGLSATEITQIRVPLTLHPRDGIPLRLAVAHKK
jgi:hypothetical protein